MKLKDIFKTNMALLNEPEVKELIKHAESEYKKVYEAYKKLDDLEFAITNECMNSEIIVKGGKNSKEVVVYILNLLEENCKK
jgi:hypothetical protein